MMGVFCTRDKNQVYGVLDAIREGLIDLMTTNQVFIDSITLGTSEGDRVANRFDLVRQLVDDLLQGHRPQPRCFTYQLKEALYNENSTCAICDQKINHMDDEAVDHIEQYWKGGQTIPENARLTHRFCNLSRPRND